MTDEAHPMGLKVVVTDYIEPDLLWEAEQCQQMGVGFESYQLKTAGPAELIRAGKDADVIVVNMAQFNAPVIEGLERCKLIIRHGIGYDNVDLEAATRRNIQVVNVPDYCVNEVAEQAVMLMMACQRKILVQSQLLQPSVRSGQWDFLSIYPVYRLAGKTVGIVGFGRIGSTVYRMLQGFNVHFLIADPYISEKRKEEYGIRTSPFEQVVRESDIITIHVPLKWEETYHMFDSTQFGWMKPTAVLVNTSRGGIVNLDALDLALRQGKLAMAGIDVYEQEPPSPDFPLLNNPRSICTPHLSWLSEEAGLSIRQKIVEDIRRFRDGEPQQYPVNSIDLAVNA